MKSRSTFKAMGVSDCSSHVITLINCAGSTEPFLAVISSQDFVLGCDYVVCAQVYVSSLEHLTVCHIYSYIYFSISAFVLLREE